MNVLKNYKVLKEGGFEEYPAIEIRYDDKEVFADLLVCAIPYGVEYEAPLLLSINQQGVANVADRAVFLRHLSEKTQKVYFTLDAKGNVVRTSKETELYTRLPVADNPDDYVYDYRAGQIYVIDTVNKKKNKKKQE